MNLELLKDGQHYPQKEKKNTTEDQHKPVFNFTPRIATISTSEMRKKFSESALSSDVWPGLPFFFLSLLAVTTMVRWKHYYKPG